MNFHRNVIFANEHVPELPISYFEAPIPELLWGKLAEQCSGDCQYLTIPHNSNLSSGLMFRDHHTPAPDFLRMAVNLGAAHCLRKPFKPRELLAAIDHCLAEPAPALRYATAAMEDAPTDSGRTHR